MYSAMKERVKPFKILSEEAFPVALAELEDNFHVFIQRDGRIAGYISLKDIARRNNILTWESALSVMRPIEGLEVFKINQPVTLPFLFQMLGEAIVIIQDEDGQWLGYMEREEMLVQLFRKENQNINFLKLLLASIPMGMFVINREKTIVNGNDTGLKMIRSKQEHVIGKDATTIFPKEHIDHVFATGETLLNQIHITNEMGVLVDYSPIIGETKQEIDGVVIIVQDLPMVEQMALEIEFVKDLNRDLNAILSTVYDQILVVSSKGKLLRHSDNFIADVWKEPLKHYVGKSLLALKEEFPSNIVKSVMERQAKVTCLHETGSGKKILSVAKPVFGDGSELQRIVIASRDITENTRLKSELRETKEISKKYKKELEHLKNKARKSERIVYCSSKIEHILTQIEKLANFSSTVLIHGESGVGKELFAKEIHRRGNRSQGPFLTINCGAIPENLLESELFGYVKGAFTGADTNGKVGYFQQASGGVLFLDEIGEISLPLQVKLLRVLQENEVVPIGSTKPIPVDVQIITATNKDLEKMVEEGQFREDLFYRIHVFPLYIPPLRERPEDIPLLAYHFLQQFNEKYNKQYHFAPEALQLLEAYRWPGNVRELQNVIERLFITADDDIITAEEVGQLLKFPSFRGTKPMITGLMPLKEAVDHVEEQLVTMAMKQYKTTTMAAKALGISQSAVSRKYKKIKERQKA